MTADKALIPIADIPSSYRLLDAIGINEYLGWYSGHSEDLPAALRTVRRRFPRQALFITELGAEANRTGPATERGTYAFQRRYLEAHLRLIDASPLVSGVVVWALRDFAVHPGWRGGNPKPRPPILYKGLLSQAGNPKPAFDLVRDRFAALPYAK
jgi:beta-glucuronidase